MIDRPDLSPSAGQRHSRATLELCSGGAAPRSPLIQRRAGLPGQAGRERRSLYHGAPAPIPAPGLFGAAQRRRRGGGGPPPPPGNSSRQRWPAASASLVPGRLGPHKQQPAASALPVTAAGQHSGCKWAHGSRPGGPGSRVGLVRPGIRVRRRGACGRGSGAPQVPSPSARRSESVGEAPEARLRLTDSDTAGCPGTPKPSKSPPSHPSRH